MALSSIWFCCAFWNANDSCRFEIGVYKGQTISLAALVAEKLGFDVAITAVSPFEGNQAPLSFWRAAANFVFRSDWRTQYLLGNLHPAGDYLADNRRTFGE